MRNEAGEAGAAVMIARLEQLDGELRTMRWVFRGVVVVIAVLLAVALVG